MSEWLEHVREKYEQIYDYGFYQWAKGIGAGISAVSAVILVNNLLYYYNTPSSNGDVLREVLLPASGFFGGLVVYGVGRFVEAEEYSSQFKADMRQVELERKRAGVDKKKTAAIASLDEQITAIEKLRASNN